jgi:predicted DNA-binding transcriptional regulator YafY
VRAKAAPRIVQLLRWVLGTRVRIGPTGDDGWVEVELRGHHAPAIAGEIAGFGADLDVLEPQEVRDQLAQIGRELVDRYERN